MKKIGKILLIIVACCIGIVGLGLFALSRLLPDMCGNEIFHEALLPGGRFKAVTFQRDCGATTGFSTQISLIPSNAALPNEGGNIFITKGHPKDTNIETVWLNSTELVIKHTAGLEAFKKETSRKGIRVTYE